MNCTELEANLIEFFEGELDQEFESAALEHIATCERCEAVLRETQAVITLANQHGRVRLGTDQRRRLLHRLSSTDAALAASATIRPTGPTLPGGLELVRTTTEFDESSVPASLLVAHTTANRVWGRLVVREGEVACEFADQPGIRYELQRGDSIALAPLRAHRVVVSGPVRFVVEFHRMVKGPRASK